ncbi:hypothetical protein DXG01_006138 [Tephrocybe rancida]|nr:hypothetical protein DXG01_006138 [Tephrocybe rancida]
MEAVYRSCLVLEAPMSSSSSPSPNNVTRSSLKCSAMFPATTSFGGLNSMDVLCALVGVFILGILARRGMQREPLPPGPRGYPLIGNVLDLPSTKQWLTFTEWGKQYGEIVSITVFGQPIIVLNSVKIANDMLDKKSNIYCDRPIMQMAGNLVGWKNSLVLLPYGDRFRRFRRMFHTIIGSRASVSQFSHIEELETRRFLRRVLASPTELATHVQHIAGAIILRISHGYEVKESNDPFVELSDRVMEHFALCTAPGAFLVDVLPILRYVPTWIPGAGFQRKAKEWSANLHEMSEGAAPVSLTSSLLEGTNVDQEGEFDIKWCSASLLLGGADTTVSSNYSFFLAMTLYPEVAKKAQAEIDSVVGNNRLPTFEDRPHLPYVDALSKEVFRWNSVAPLGGGYCISLVSTVFIVCIATLSDLQTFRGLMRDPEIYDDPDSFCPDRFIAMEGKPAELDPRSICFGFGRRICPGIHLADASVFILCAMSLAVFDISKTVENGVVIEPVHENTGGSVSHPKPYKCSIKPRSKKAASLILEAETRG